MPSLKKILLCLPTTSQTMNTGTAITVASTVKALHSTGVDVDLHNIDSAEIVTARDMFANMVLHSDKWDGLFFIDSDVSFDSALAREMVALGEDICAATYPRRQLDLERLFSGIREHGDLRKAQAQASSFTLKTGWSDDAPPFPAVTKAGFSAVAAVGMGCALISKAALAAMVDEKVVKPRLDLFSSSGETCWSFFDNIEVDGSRLGEDYSFCHRWTVGMKRKLWVRLDKVVNHLGQFAYNARYADLMR